MEAYAIPLAALVIAGATLVFATYNLRHKANGSTVVSLEHRVETLERKLAECEAESRRLLNQNIELMRRLVDAE